MKKKAVVIGSGFAGMSSACFLANAGWQVTVLEKNATAGGRARQLKEAGFTFDMGPSWYWMPDVFDRFFHCFGKKTSDYYQLKRLDPSYRVYWPGSTIDIPADYISLKTIFENIEPGSGEALDQFMEQAAFKYKLGMHKMVFDPSLSFTGLMNWDLLKGLSRSGIFTSIKKHIARYFKDHRIQQLLEFPVLFLGALPGNTPALYSLMNYADTKLGTWYPQGGMYSIVNAMHSLAKEQGVEFLFDHNVTSINVENGITKNVAVDKNIFAADAVIGAADYHFIENNLLTKNYLGYPEEYWKKRTMAPSCLIYFIGLNKKLNNITHHSLFFDSSFEIHADELYTKPQWPSEPLFYVSVTSVTDDTVAPGGCENLFFLVPVAAGLTGDTGELREFYFKKILDRFEKHTGEKIKDSIIFKRSYSVSNFTTDYNSFKGNAYGLANTLMQTAILKPRMRSKKVKNLFYAGQLTVPGPGVPPCLISGEIAAKEILKDFN